MRRLIFVILFSAIILLGAACSLPHTTNTARSAVEEGLTCAVVEQALNRADISKYKGKTVFLDYTYLAPQVQKELSMGYMEKCCAANAMPVTREVEKADVIFQLFCGVLATDIDKFLIGTPELPVPVPDTDLSIVIPEIAIFSKYTRTAYARFFLTIIDAKTGRPLETISELNGHASFINWIVLLVPFITHSTGLDNEEGKSEVVPVWEN